MTLHPACQWIVYETSHFTNTDDPDEIPQHTKSVDTDACADPDEMAHDVHAFFLIIVYPPLHGFRAFKW